MKKTLVIVAHPDIENSRGNKALSAAISADPAITVHHLYQQYPDFKIDVAREQALILAHAHIVLQFPMYWYSSPALLKKWLDDVINDGLFGSAPEKSQVLHGKTLQLAVTIGRIKPRYFPTSANEIWDTDVLIPYIKPELITLHGKQIVQTLLIPFEQTAHLAGMQYAPPFIIYNVGSTQRRGSIDAVELAAQCAHYHNLIKQLD